MDHPFRKALLDLRQLAQRVERFALAQILEYIVHLLGVNLLVEFIGCDIDVIELEIHGIDSRKSLRAFLFDFLLQLVYSLSLIDINQEVITSTLKEADNVVHLEEVTGDGSSCIYHSPSRELTRWPKGS
jgi:hypothetical protein